MLGDLRYYSVRGKVINTCAGRNGGRLRTLGIRPGVVVKGVVGNGRVWECLPNWAISPVIGCWQVLACNDDGVADNRYYRLLRHMIRYLFTDSMWRLRGTIGKQVGSDRQPDR